MHKAKSSRSTACAVIMSILLMSSANSPVLSQSQPQLKLTGKRATAPRPSAAMDCEPDTLLIMPNSGADKDEIAAALQEVHGTVTQTIGSGSMTTLVVRTEKGQLDAVEKKLSKDSHFSRIQRNVNCVGQIKTSNDPYFPQEWHLSALNVPSAWDTSTGRGTIIAIADSGCQGTNADLNGKTYCGLDYMSGGNTPTGNFDAHTQGSHGTAMATIAAAYSNNKKLTAGVSDSYIFPFRIANETPAGGTKANTQQMVSTLWECGSRGIRICSISYSALDPANSYANPSVHPVLHEWMKWYHDSRNGLVIFSTGNEGKYDPSNFCPYMIMCSGIGKDYRLVDFSNWGKCVWFTGPASEIVCSDRNGRVVSVQGTSCVPPMIAGIAALIIAKNPGMSNKQVEQALIKSCSNSTTDWNMEFGYGLPDAAKALRSTSKGIGDDDELGAEAVFPTPEGPSFVIEKVDDSAVKESKEGLLSTPSDKPTFPSR